VISLDLSGRVALVTGGSRGLGRADALTLARAGADVVIADILVESELDEGTDEFGVLATVARQQGLVYSEQTAQEIQALGRRSAAIRCDVTDRDQVAAAVERVVAEFGSVDILVNNAGTLDHAAQFEKQKPELWERDLRVNLTGAFNCAQAVFPHMKERGWGRIVNMASVAGTLGGFGQASYSTTKAGLLGLTKTLAMEGGRHGITANAIVPGIIGTEAFHHGECRDERADREPHRLQAAGRAAGRSERDRVPLLRPRRVRDGDRIQRLRRPRALRLLTAVTVVAFATFHGRNILYKPYSRLRAEPDTGRREGVKMRGTFCGRRLSVICGIAAAAVAAPAAALAAPPVTGALPTATAAPAVPVSTPSVPAAPAAPAAVAPVVNAVAAAPAAAAGLKATVAKSVGTLKARTKPMPTWKLKKLRVHVHFGPRTGSTGGTVATCTPSGGWMICRNLPLVGELVNTCNNDETVTINGTFTEMSRVDIDPIRMTVTTYDNLIWTHVTGEGSFGNKYVAADVTTTYSRQRTFGWGVSTRTGRQEAQALVSFNRGVADQYIFMRSFTTVIVRTDGTVDVDVDIRGPGISCVNNTRDCDDRDYNDDWGRH
jgi:3-oxoacyl-[acyl-carrier protein] reductase